MSPEGWYWTKKREAAAVLLAQGQLQLQEIAKQVGVSGRAIIRWKKYPEFIERVEEHLAIFAEKLRAEGLRNLVNRIEAYNDRWERMRRVITERAVDPEMEDVPGGKTGLLVHRIKVIGQGKKAQVVHEYEVDTGLLKELRAHEEQAAKELGQWAPEKHEFRGEGGGPLKSELTVVVKHVGQVDIQPDAA